MSIVGEAFLPYVVDQINTRQKILGKLNRDSKDLAWEVGKTSWIKLASSVNIRSETITAPDGKGGSIEVNNSGSSFRQKFLGLTGQNYEGNKLASELVLQGGALLNGNLRSGITQNNDILPSNPSSYGFGGTEFGIQPIPGITSFNLKSYNNGTLREATLSILANNRKQFEYIDTLYLRLGYTMLLEWGNTSYPTSINPSGEATYVTGADITSLSLIDDFIGTTVANNQIPTFQNKIEENRKKSSGNYDGLMGIVKNFSWEFNKDGTYNINLILISAGSVIESLKINNQVEGISYTAPSGSTPSDSARESALATFIDLATTPKTEVIKGNIYTTPIKNYLTQEEMDQLSLSTNWLVREGAEGHYTYPVLSCNASFGVDDSTFLKYVHFGSLLSFISKKLLTYDSEGEINFTGIDYSSDTYVYSNGWQFSSDPKKLIVGFHQKVNKTELIFFKDATTTISQFHSTTKGVKVGRLMNVYFEQQYLIDVLTNNQDSETGGVFLDKFLNTLLNDINVCLGNVNKIKYRVNQVKVGKDKFKDKIQFYDEVSIYGKETITGGNYDYSLNLYGFSNPGSYIEGTFVTDYSLKTEISKRLQTQIAIGAQAGGQAVGFDSTAISRWNVGLVDRVNPVKLDANQVKKTLDKNYTDFIKLSNTYFSYLYQIGGALIKAEFDTTTYGEDVSIAFSSVLGSIYGVADFTNALLNLNDYGQGRGYVFPNFNLNSTEGKNSWSGFQSIQSMFFSKVMAGDALSKGIATPFIGFLPINFTLTMDGISGVRIFDKLQVNSKFLPPNYGETLEFIITGLDHKIEKNKWVTIFETTSIPKLSQEVSLTFGDFTTNNLPSVLTPPNNLDSYFVLKSDSNSSKTSKGSSSKKSRKTSSGKTSIDSILQLINKTPEVQIKFKTFLGSILETYPKGYKFSINDIGRPIDSVTGVGLASAHIYSLAIDLSVYNVETGARVLGLNQTPEGVKEWVEFGIPALANAAGLDWGGNFAGGGWKYDTVHFTVPSWAKYSSSIQTHLFKDLPKLKAALSKKNDNDLRYLKSLDLRNYVFYGDNSVNTDPLRIIHHNNSGRK